MYSSGYTMAFENKPSGTIAAGTEVFSYDCPRELTVPEYLLMSSFPEDYDTKGSISLTRYIVGMSVPPFLARAVAAHVNRHWLQKLVDDR